MKKRAGGEFLKLIIIVGFGCFIKEGRAVKIPDGGINLPAKISDDCRGLRIYKDPH